MKKITYNDIQKHHTYILQYATGKTIYRMIFVLKIHERYFDLLEMTYIDLLKGKTYTTEFRESKFYE